MLGDMREGWHSADACWINEKMRNLVNEIERVLASCASLGEVGFDKI